MGLLFVVYPIWLLLLLVNYPTDRTLFVVVDLLPPFYCWLVLLLNLFDWMDPGVDWFGVLLVNCFWRWQYCVIVELLFTTIELLLRYCWTPCCDLFPSLPLICCCSLAVPPPQWMPLFLLLLFHSSTQFHCFCSLLFETLLGCCFVQALLLLFFHSQ